MVTLSTPTRDNSVFYEMYMQSMKTGFSMSKATDDGEVAVIHENIWRKVKNNTPTGAAATFVKRYMECLNVCQMPPENTSITNLVKDCCKSGVKYDKHLL